MQRDRRSFVACRLDRDAPAHQLDQPARDDQADAGAGHVAAFGAQTIEGNEEARLLLGRQPDAGVAHGNDHPGRHVRTRLDRHAAATARLYLIAFESRLFSTCRMRVPITQYLQARCSRRGRASRPGLCACTCWIRTDVRRPCRTGPAARCLTRSRPRFDARQVEHLVDQLEQVRAANLTSPRQASMASRRHVRRARNHLEEAEDRNTGAGRAELVARICDMKSDLASLAFFRLHLGGPRSPAVRS